MPKDADLRRAESLRMQIVEDVLNLRCPHCKTVFEDFSGCFNLTCSRSYCGAQFCAHCLIDYGVASYTLRHLPGCPILNGGSGTLHEFRAYHRSFFCQHHTHSPNHSPHHYFC